MNKRLWYGLMAGGGVVGLIAAFLQMLEKIQLLKYIGKPVACDLNSVFSCSNVLNAWQSSVFGFPNSLMCIIFFTVFVVAGLAGLSGTKLSKGFRLGVHALALFVLGFALWFLWQSIYVIGALCILCIFCSVGLLVVNAAWLRVNVSDLPLGDRARTAVQRLIQRDLDIVVWILLAVLVGVAMLLRFQ